MIFSSIDFLYLYLPFSIVFYYGLGGYLGHRFTIIILSVVFYAIWSVPYLFLMLGLILLNYCVAVMIKKANSCFLRKSIFSFGVISALSALGYFKYSYFFVNDILKLDASFFENIILPLAISFYTFQQIAFLTHVYDKTVQQFDLLTYSAYILFFPQLIAGPIVDYTDVEKDLRMPVRRDTDRFFSGMTLFAIGFFKKTIFADYFAIDSDYFYSTGIEQGVGFTDAWYGSLSYTLQLYFDFSGYCDMAIGLGLMFGLTLPINFNSPYKATSIQDFWRRWHITLGRFLNRHIYRVFGGNRKGFGVELLAGFITFVVGGVWHGAGFTFVLWGALHGLYLLLNKLYKRFIDIPLGVFSILLTFLAVHLAWVPFRAESIDDALSVYRGMISPLSVVPHSLSTFHFLTIVSGLSVAFFLPNSLQIIGYGTVDKPLLNTLRGRWVLISGVLISVCVLKLLLVPHTAFIYYDF